MLTIGINCSGYTSSAALLKDGQLLAAGAEERFDRQKYSRNFPEKAIRFCLKQAGARLEDVDVFAIDWNPAINIMRLRKPFSGQSRYRGEYFYSVPSHLLQMLGCNDSSLSEQVITTGNKKLRIVYVNHHDAHAAQAFFTSTFKDASIITVDGFGERATTQFAVGRGNRITPLKCIDFPRSMGVFYAVFTQFLGYHENSDEWKVMGAAPYGNPERFRKHFEKIIHWNRRGEFEIDLTYFNYFNYETKRYYNEKFLRLFGPARKPDEPLTQRHFDLAATLQRTTEQVLFSMLNGLYEMTGNPRLCLSGGVIMNSVFNGKILRNTRFREVHIPPSTEDAGTSIGSALYAYRSVAGGRRRFLLEHDFWGPSWTNREVERILRKYSIPYERVDNIEEVTARLIAEGRVIGRFSGRMEFGARALGNRSILADPRREEMKDRVNSIIKFRESYRPFAPSILEEEVRDYFDIEKDMRVPFMEKVYPVKKSKRALVPAVTHVDGSGRLQTVNRLVNPKYYRLIRHFRKLTGIPIVLNTSFNLQGEPIVCAPEDAIRTFFTSGLDYLTLEDCLVKK